MTDTYTADLIQLPELERTYAVRLTTLDAAGIKARPAGKAHVTIALSGRGTAAGIGSILIAAQAHGATAAILAPHVARFAACIDAARARGVKVDTAVGMLAVLTPAEVEATVKAPRKRSQGKRTPDAPNVPDGTGDGTGDAGTADNA